MGSSSTATVTPLGEAEKRRAIRRTLSTTVSDGDYFNPSKLLLKGLSEKDKADPSLKTLLQFLATFDDNNDGKISLSALAAITETAQATLDSAEGRFGLKCFPQTLRDELSLFDQDGNGYIEASELAAGAKALLAQRAANKQMSWIVMGLLLAVIISMTSNFAMVLAGTEMSKENHVADSTLVDLNGDAVRVDTVKSFGSLLDLPLFPNEDLETLNFLSVTVAWNNSVMFGNHTTFLTCKVASIVKLTAKNTVYVTCFDGLKFHVTGTAARVFDAAGTKVGKVLIEEHQQEHARARRMQARWPPPAGRRWNRVLSPSILQMPLSKKKSGARGRARGFLGG